MQSIEHLEKRRLLSGVISRLTLVNADTNRDLFPLIDGIVLNLATLPTRNLNIRADVAGAKTRSVRFSLDHLVDYKIENHAPFAIGGDARGGKDYLPWSAPLGSHTLTATPFLYDQARGKVGTPLTIHFRVIDATTPIAPVQLDASAISASDVQLSWTDSSSNESGYVVQRSTDGVNFDLIATLAADASSYLDTDAAAETTYHYQVVAFNDAGQSDAVAANVSTPPLLAPPAPVTDFVALSRSSANVELYWHDWADNEAGFRVYRSDNGSSFERLATVGSDIEMYLDREVQTGVKYWYRVAAFNSTGESEYSDTDDASPASTVAGRDPVNPPPQTPTPGVLQSPPQAAIDFAKQQTLIRYNKGIAGGAYTNLPSTGEGPMTMALAAYAGNTTADVRLLEQIRHVLIGGNDVPANGGYPAQHERHMTGAFALAKLTPRIWNQLTDMERKKIDLSMKAALIASAFTTADNNPWVKSGGQQRALDGDTNMNRSWNPNYREGMIGGVLVGIVYFGGPENVAKILETYNHARFTAELGELGLTNAFATFSGVDVLPNDIHAPPTGPQIEAAIKDYRYLNVPLSDYLNIYDRLASNTFNRNVNCGLNNGIGFDTDDDGIADAGKIVSGCSTLPNFGALGMLTEFDSIDGEGARSSAQYSHDGWRVHLTNHLVLVAGGYWQANTQVATTALTRMSVGSIDLWYKLEHGYVNYQKGEAKTTFFSTTPNHNFELTGPMWQAVKNYHGLT